ncbi:MAG: hypothetical protein JST58_02100 [Bacteroidetes bacterium]|nr:hypothetical protein [Bacteroidota bacterium]
MKNKFSAFVSKSAVAPIRRNKECCDITNTSMFEVMAKLQSLNHNEEK